MKHPHLLDLYCCQGGASMGYHRAGFQITGVDNKPQPRYPFHFIQSDARSYLLEHGHEYDAIHFSPPCQKYSVTNNMNKLNHSDELELLLPMLPNITVPWIVENVEQAPMPACLILTGLMFHLSVIRKRIFYSNINLSQPFIPPQKRKYLPGKHIYTVAGSGGNGNTNSAWSHAMDIHWMTLNGLRESIPPAYTQFIGAQFMSHLLNDNNNTS